ncbi:MAG: amino acid permease [Acidobacteria bacterium]|nr:amino acid permease [Acidobacteriota bacterium]
MGLPHSQKGPTTFSARCSRRRSSITKPLIAKNPRRTLLPSIGIFTATSVVVANVIGAGIFTTPGFLARDLGSPQVMLAIWILGALLSLAGALTYSELGAAYPEAGGEYVYLREAYGPLWGYLSGWTSFFVGFSAPIAAACIGFSAYLSHFAPPLALGNILLVVPLGSWQWRLSGGQVAALAALGLLSLAHISGVQRGAKVQVVLTVGKTAAIVALILFGLTLGTGNWSHLHSAPQGVLPEQAFPNLPISLIFVLYCFSGWNAAAYLAGEIRMPQRNIPLGLLAGTLIVTVLYLGLNLLFLYALPISEMSGVLEVGEKASLVLFGPVATHVVAAIMALSILASASAMVLAGPRVYFAMAGDGLFPKKLAVIHSRFHSPASAILFQSLWAAVLILTGTFEQLIVYSGFVLVLFSALAVAAVMVLRRRHPKLDRPFRVPLYPYTPLVFVGFSIWILFYTLFGRPMESLLGIVTVLLGLPLYFWGRRRLTQPSPSTSLK